MTQKKIAILSVLLMIGLAGCATISVSSEVGDTETIERYELEINTSTTVYGLLQASAEEDGYDSFEESITEDIDEGTVEYNEEIDGDDVTMSLLVTDTTPSEFDNVTIKKEDEKIIYTDEVFSDGFGSEESSTNESFLSTNETVELNYKLVMPGEITDSNADKVDGNTATWVRSGEEAGQGFVVEAESETPTSQSVPGFGVPASIIALVSSILIMFIIRHN